ncbi:MAG: 23S rRNA (adenine(2503)-C(2))-methyltransferase [Clostridiales bacterium GWD2_32_19]|nr:MAG: 23S rRNA (adenine(2503)-C(2))-methyltransferase [Clostridiales bacterium GWD2_32_19]
MEIIDLLSLTYEELETYLVENAEKKFRAKQIFDWLHNKKVENFDDMTNISKEFLLKLKETSYLTNMELVEKQVSKIDETTKYLFKLNDGNFIESVFMKYKFGNSVCISSQIGCHMGCSFCASTVNGLVRNLTAGEMVKQIYRVEKDTNERVSNVVIMGSGEPFENYDNVIKFIKNITNPNGLNIGQRHISVSTCGLVDKIYKFADEKTQVNLAISLHASNDDIRKQIMPIAKKYSINEIIEACKYYVKVSNRRVNIEYSMMKDINDDLKYARELAHVLKGLLCYVNLIPVNEIAENDYKKANMSVVNNFARELDKCGIQTTVRRELGADIDAACGQLRNKQMGENK